MSTLPLRLDWKLASDRWASIINPVVNNEINGGVLIGPVALINGTTVINHRLGRKMQGWMLADQDGPAAIYRSQPFNALTLSLTSSAACNIMLWCF